MSRIGCGPHFKNFYTLAIKYILDILPAHCVQKRKSSFRGLTYCAVIILPGVFLFTHLFVLILATSMITQQMFLIINWANKPHCLSSAASQPDQIDGESTLKHEDSPLIMKESQFTALKSSKNKPALKSSATLN